MAVELNLRLAEFACISHARVPKLRRPRATQLTQKTKVPGRPSSADDSGTGHDLDDAKAKFREGWASIRAGLTELDIARARHYAEASREALARYDRKR